MGWLSSAVIRLLSLLIFVQATALCSPVTGFIPAQLAPAGFSPSWARETAAAAAEAAGAIRSDTRCDAFVPSGSPATVAGTFARRGSTRQLSMSMSPAPPVKPPKRRGTGGGGNGDDLFVRELIEPEKSVILTSWRDYAKRDGGEKFDESIQILNEMIAWRSGVIAARKRRFTLACCKGSAVQAVACVQIGPKNESVRSFLAQEACMSVCLLNVDPASPQFKAGAHLLREIKDIGKLENMPVSFDPIKEIYSGRFYAATLAM